MSEHTDHLTTIAQWLQEEGEALLYYPDGEPADDDEALAQNVTRVQEAFVNAINRPLHLTIAVETQAYDAVLAEVVRIVQALGHVRQAVAPVSEEA